MLFKKFWWNSHDELSRLGSLQDTLLWDFKKIFKRTNLLENAYVMLELWIPFKTIIEFWLPDFGTFVKSASIQLWIIAAIPNDNAFYGFLSRSLFELLTSLKRTSSRYSIVYSETKPVIICPRDIRLRSVTFKPHFSNKG